MKTRVDTIASLRIESLLWLQQRSIIFRPDYIIFCCLCVVLIALSPSIDSFYNYLGVGIIICGIVLSKLCETWSHDWHLICAYKKVDSVINATALSVTPVVNNGASAVCPISQQSSNVWLFRFQNLTFVAHIEPKEEEIVVTTLPFPVCKPVEWYHTQHGFSNSTELDHAIKTYGAKSNRLDMPAPTFSELFKEHALAPFFVFQVFCVALWCLDEYWYYSLFTLVMLCFLEATLVFQRIHQHSSLRRMRPAPAPVMTYREGVWKTIPAEDVLPGDIVSLCRNFEFENEQKKKAMEARKRPSAWATYVSQIQQHQRQVREWSALDPHTKANTTAPVAPKMPPLKQLFKSAFGQSDQPQESTICPADVVLLRGHVVVNEAMLTGESIPHVKQAFAARESIDEENVSNGDMNGWFANKSSHIVYAGTVIVSTEARKVVSDAKSQAADTADGNQTSTNQLPSPPDGGAIAYVLRTGFYTSQGDLMRTIMFSSQRVTVNNSEAYKFLLLLLVFAIAASMYVLYYGIGDESRSQYKLLLHCIMIVTSVVPPELPIELSMAVNASLSALVRRGVFCTEPFRIPLAGKVDTCCYDKTGTLTTERLDVKGVVCSPFQVEKIPPIPQRSNWSSMTKLVLAGCHNVMSIASDANESESSSKRGKFDRVKNKGDVELVGDPLEVSVLQYMHCTVEHDKVKGLDQSIHILHRYPFVAALRRMTTIVAYGNDQRCMILTKGAPEAIEPLLKNKPEHYSQVYTALSATGARVLALAYKSGHSNWKAKDIVAAANGTLSNATIQDSLERHLIEADLKFAGFVVLDCPLKKDSASIIQELTNADLRVVMITGDNALTAHAVARETGIVDSTSKTIVLDCDGDHGTLHWYTYNQGDCIVTPFSHKNQSTMNNYVVTGNAIELLLQQNDVDVSNILTSASIFARVSPQQKEDIIAAINANNHTTLMCGDGTNDVGALKRASVGISIVSDPSLEAATAAFTSKQDEVKQELLAHSSQHQTSNSSISTRQGSNSSIPARQMELQKQLQELKQDMAMQSQVAKLGDASIASPFTSKSPSIGITAEVLKQGRCTLVTTHQMFRILAVNSLVASYQLSVLSMYGVKSGDTQATVAGMCVAMFFMFVSTAKPTGKLSKQKVHSTVFNRGLMLSVFGQFIVHLITLYIITSMCAPLITETIEVDGTFSPNVLNTAIFIVGLCMQTTTFAVNYHGLPFMQSLRSNVPLFRGLLFTYALCAVLALDLFPEISEMLELVAMPTTNLRIALVTAIAGDTILCFVLDAMTKSFK